MSIHLTKHLITSAARPTLPNSNNNLLRRLQLAASLWWQRYATANALHGLSDRMLADIGLQRSDIPHIAAGQNHRDLRAAPLESTARGEHAKGDAWLQAA
nr:DUF1127 domain-containing protein [Litoreibacter halocynthiae]